MELRINIEGLDFTLTGTPQEMIEFLTEEAVRDVEKKITEISAGKEARLVRTRRERRKRARRNSYDEADTKLLKQFLEAQKMGLQRQGDVQRLAKKMGRTPAALYTVLGKMRRA